MPPSDPPTLSISIVVYRSDLVLLRACLDSVESAARCMADAGLGRCVLDLIDNGPPEYSRELSAFLSEAPKRQAVELRCVSGHGNLGYGAANNLSIFDRESRFHLILNPDTELQPDALCHAVDFMERHSDVVLLAAASFDEDGAELNLCKSYPSVLVLALRALGGAWIRRHFEGRLAEYERVGRPAQTTDGGTAVHDVSDGLVSGSFMFCRSDALKQVGGFDPAYFLYFEDFDLSRRMSRIGRLMRLTTVRLIHHGGQAARKGLRHQWLFARGAWRFFGRYGWRLV